MGTIKDVLQYPSARLTQHLRLSIGTVNSPLDVLEFRLEQALNETYVADITLTSTDKEIDGAACVGRRATFMVEEKAAIPSAPGLVVPVVEPALLVHGVVTQWERVKASRDAPTRLSTVTSPGAWHTLRYWRCWQKSSFRMRREIPQWDFLRDALHGGIEHG